MASENIKEIANQSIQTVEHFFANLLENEKALLPSVLKKDGTWFGNSDDYSLGIFFLTTDEFQRIKSNIEKGLPAFPGFFVSDSTKPANVPIAIKASGSCNYFASNHTSNLIAFNISPEASFTVIDHFHEVKDSSGQEFKYQVDLAFFLGIMSGEQWDKFKPRLLELLDYSLKVWKSMQ